MVYSTYRAGRPSPDTELTELLHCQVYALPQEMERCIWPLDTQRLLACQMRISSQWA